MEAVRTIRLYTIWVRV